MSTVSLTGNDTIQIMFPTPRVLTDFGDGDICTVTFANDVWEVVAGKGGNSAYSYNNKGNQAEMELKLMRGSDDDAFLSRIQNITKIDPPSTPLLQFRVQKRIGNGLGMVNPDNYLLEGGVIARTPDSNTSSDGKTDDAQVVYRIKFGNCSRVQ